MENVQAERSSSIMRKAMKRRGLTQRELADTMGTTQTAVSGNMTRYKIGLDTFSRIMAAMEYDVVVIDRKTGQAEWKVY